MSNIRHYTATVGALLFAGAVLLSLYYDPDSMTILVMGLLAGLMMGMPITILDVIAPTYRVDAGSIQTVGQVGEE